MGICNHNRDLGDGKIEIMEYAMTKSLSDNFSE